MTLLLQTRRRLQRADLRIDLLCLCPTPKEVLDPLDEQTRLHDQAAMAAS